MGIIQKDALRTAILSYIGLIIGYINKGVLFICFLTTEQIGLINLLISVGLLFSQLSNLGYINTIWRFFPFFRESKNKDYGLLKFSLKKVFYGCLFFAAISFIFNSQILSLFNEKSPTFASNFYWILPIGIANVLFLIFEIYLRGMHKNVISVFANEFLHRLISTALILAFGFEFISFDVFLIVFSLSFFIPALTLVIYLIKLKELSFSKWKTNIPSKFQKIMYSYSAYSYLNTLGSVVVITMDSIMIAIIIGLKATGIYTTVLYIISALQIPNKSILRVSSSLVAKYWKDNDMIKMNELYIKVSSTAILISLYLFLIVWTNAYELISFLPKEYEVGVYTFFFFMIGKLIDSYLGLNGVIFITSKKYKYDFYFTSSLLIMVFVLNLYLIPLYGIIGAAISTSFALIIYNLGRMYFLWKWYKLHPFELNQLYIIILFFAVLFLFELNPYHLSNKYLNIILNSVVLTVLYFGTIIKLKLNEDLNGYISKVFFKIFKRELKLN